ncbi:helix-turn-helix transcriptional regulator [Halosimplex sp. J119]
MDETTSELVDLLRRRRGLVAALREDAREKRDLVREQDLPRSTLDRAVRELEAADLVEYADGTYALTALGEHLVDEFDSFVERTELAVALEPFLRWTSPESFDLDLRSLADADLWTPEPGDPWAMVNRHVHALEHADHVRGVLPLVGLHAVETAHERIIEDGADHQFVVDPGVAERLRTDENYLPLFRELQARAEPTFLRYGGEIPYFVGIFDDEFVQIGVDDEGTPRALVETNDADALAWARDTIKRFQRQADSLPEDSGSES